MTILSIDLAYKRYADLGVVAISHGGKGFRCELLTSPELSCQPEPQRLAAWALGLAESIKASCIMLDGPQAWKDPDNGLLHSRICERELNAPAKTGLPGCVKPGNYLSFVEFSIQVFSWLDRFGWPRLVTYSQAEDAELSLPCVIESLPLAAWRALGLPILPAKRKARREDIADRLIRLQDIYPLDLTRESVSHDQLQALVSGLGAADYVFGDRRRTAVAGIPPKDVEAITREGYILNPSRQTSVQLQ